MAKPLATFSIKKTTEDLATSFKHMLSNEAKINGYLNRVVYPEVLKRQAERWATQGASETGSWGGISVKYLKWRKKAFPEAGEKILVRTGDLAKSMTAIDKTNHFKMVRQKTLEVGTLLGYAEHVDFFRDITDFSEDTIDELVDGLEDYLVEGSG